MASPDPRPVVLVAIDWYLPAYRAGGPIRSVANLVAALGDDLDFRIVCGDRDLSAADPLPVEMDQWQPRDKASILYLPRAQWTASRWSALLREVQPDRLYLNSLYSGPFSRLPWRVARDMDVPTTLAPRGMLGAGALSVKPWRKRAWLWMQKLTGAYRDIRWHASTEQEADEIRAWFPDATVDVALNLPVPFNPAPLTREPGTLRILSVGRIHPIKNYRFGLEVAASLVQDGVTVQYRIVGPIEEAQEAERLKAQAAAVQLELVGGVPPTETRDHFAWADLVLVPSFNENFGHAVAEAVATGRPALVSDQTAWSALDPGPSVRCLPLDLGRGTHAAGDLLAMPVDDLLRTSEDTHHRCLLTQGHLTDQRALFEP